MMKRGLAALSAAVLMIGIAAAETVSTFPLRISDNGRYLTDAADNAFLYKADTGWWLFDKLSERNYGVYLDARKEMGFNTVQVMLAWTYYRPNFYGEEPFLEACKVSTPNDAYWQRVDTFVQMAAEKDMLVNFVPLWLGYSGEEWFKVLDKNTVEECYTFGQYLGERYADCSNVMWTIGGDHDPQHLYEHEDALARGIRSKMPDAIMSAHPWENQLASDHYGKSDWLNLESVYTYFPQWNNGKQVYTLAEQAYQGNKPFILIESGYEKASIGTQVYVEGRHLRRQVYWAMLSGACGYAFGNANVWQFTALWKMEMQSEGSQYMKVASDLFESLRWWTLQPDNDLLLNAEESKVSGKAVAARAADGSFALAYLPAGSEFRLTIDTDVFTHAEWIDPASGEHVPAQCDNGTYLIPGSNHAGDNDWCLLLTK